MGPTPNHILQIQNSVVLLTSLRFLTLILDSKRQKKKSNAQKNYGFRHTPVTVAKLCMRATV